MDNAALIMKENFISFEQKLINKCFFYLLYIYHHYSTFVFCAVD